MPGFSVLFSGISQADDQQRIKPGLLAGVHHRRSPHCGYGSGIFVGPGIASFAAVFFPFAFFAIHADEDAA